MRWGVEKLGVDAVRDEAAGWRHVLHPTRRSTPCLCTQGIPSTGRRPAATTATRGTHGATESPAQRRGRSSDPPTTGVQKEGIGGVTRLPVARQRRDPPLPQSHRRPYLFPLPSQWPFRKHGWHGGGHRGTGPPTPPPLLLALHRPCLTPSPRAFPWHPEVTWRAPFQLLAAARTCAQSGDRAEGVGDV